MAQQLAPLPTHFIQTLLDQLEKVTGTSLIKALLYQNINSHTQQQYDDNTALSEWILGNLTTTEWFHIKGSDLPFRQRTLLPYLIRKQQLPNLKTIVLSLSDEADGSFEEEDNDIEFYYKLLSLAPENDQLSLLTHNNIQKKHKDLCLFEALSQLKGLKSLSIRRTYRLLPQNDGKSWISMIIPHDIELATLEKFDIASNQLDNDDLFYLSTRLKLPMLEKLDISSNYMMFSTETSIESLCGWIKNSPMNHLTSLRMRNVGIRDNMIQSFVQQCPNIFLQLQHLEMPSCKYLTKTGWNSLFNAIYPTIDYAEGLSINDNTNSSNSSTSSSQLSTSSHLQHSALHTLNLGSNSGDIEALFDVLGRFPTSLPHAPSFPLPKLQNLSFHGYKSSLSIITFVNLPSYILNNITSLSIHDCELIDHDVFLLSNCPHLTSLNTLSLHTNLNLTYKSITYLAQSPYINKLIELDFTMCNNVFSSSNALKALLEPTSSLTKLQSLVLDGVNICIPVSHTGHYGNGVEIQEPYDEDDNQTRFDDLFQQLMKSDRVLNSIKSLDFDSSGLSESCLKSLVTSSSLSNLEELILRYNPGDLVLNVDYDDFLNAFHGFVNVNNTNDDDGDDTNASKTSDLLKDDDDADKTHDWLTILFTSPQSPTRFPKLRKLNLTGCNITNEHLLALSQSPLLSNFEEIMLHDNFELTTSGLNHLLNSPYLPNLIKSPFNNSGPCYLFTDPSTTPSSEPIALNDLHPPGYVGHRSSYGSELSHTKTKSALVLHLDKYTHSTRAVSRTLPGLNGGYIELYLV